MSGSNYFSSHSFIYNLNNSPNLRNTVDPRYRRLRYTRARIFEIFPLGMRFQECNPRVLTIVTCIQLVEPQNSAKGVWRIYTLFIEVGLLLSVPACCCVLEVPFFLEFPGDDFSDIQRGGSPREQDQGCKAVWNKSPLKLSSRTKAKVAKAVCERSLS